MSQVPNKEHHQRTKTYKLLKENLPFFAKNALEIRTKEGELAPFIFNKAQLYVHAKLEEQKRNMGFVRALILKGRQQGMSTYTAARFYQHTVFNPESSTFILSHQAKTTGPLFDIVKRYHSNMPAALAPDTDTANKNQLKFAFPNPKDPEKTLISEYTVGTAGNEDIGRGFTIKQLHCSEAAFYEKTDELETGLFQAIAEAPNTEIIMESTANGIGNMFYRKAMDALAGKGIFQLIFIPWYWQLEYRTPTTPNFACTPEEENLKHLFNLDDQQILWRRNKIVTLGKVWKFQQEYPMDPAEAFVVSGESLIDKQKLLEARKCNIVDNNAPIVFGVDCARSNDRTVITARRGRQILFYKVMENTPGDTGEPSVELANVVDRLIKRWNPVKVFFDYAQGYGTIDLLNSWGHRGIIQGIYFNQNPTEKDMYLNKRSEMYINARDWIHDGNVNIPDEDDFFTECAMIPDYKESPTKKKFMVPKSEIKLKLGMSPDIWDSFILTFAFIVKYDNLKRKGSSRTVTKKSSPYQTAQRISGKPKTSTTKVNMDFT
ncbi:MAG: hypothetical protein JRJ45_00075 [Deltaproteobacteria bacterium]|nr:hypothetical protein [Deltaproteobacteria bacterium]